MIDCLLRLIVLDYIKFILVLKVRIWSNLSGISELKNEISNVTFPPILLIFYCFLLFFTAASVGSDDHRKSSEY
jgi:hypothetical protein